MKNNFIITARHIRGLPYRVINTVLALALARDVVHVSEQTLEHMLTRHPKDYELCDAYLEQVILTPEYVGQSPHHKENFEIIKRVHSHIILVAISVSPDEYGDYPVKSAYTINHDTLRRRLRKCYIKPL